MKQKSPEIASLITNVAPFTGAWIETEMHQTKKEDYYLVAPFTGAWIETG